VRSNKIRSEIRQSMALINLSKKLDGLVNTGSHEFGRDGVRMEGNKKVPVFLEMSLNGALNN
jgi:hypothetical protein